jgi:hypothetical protein
MYALIAHLLLNALCVNDSAYENIAANLRPDAP